LHSTRELEAAGGAPYLSTLIDGLPRRGAYLTCARTVHSKHLYRQLLSAAQRIETIARDSDEHGTPVGEAVDGAWEVLQGLSQLTESDEKGKTNRDAAANLVGALYDEKPLPRIKTGLRELDFMLGGFRAGEVCIITAETGVGKTFFGLQVAEKACRAGLHGLYASGEMLAEHLMGRVLCSESGVDYWKIRQSDKLNDHERAVLLETAGRQCDQCLLLDGDLTLPRIRMAARALAAKRKLGFLFVDYDELVEVVARDEWDQQRILVRAVKSLAMELQIPAFIISQLRKSLAGEDREHPTLQRLYGSGAKAKHASVVLYINRPYVQNLAGDETEAQIMVLKNRDGKMGTVDCIFNLKTFRLEQKHESEGLRLPYKEGE
jgi:replicative DNA helicase